MNLEFEEPIEEPIKASIGDVITIRYGRHPETMELLHDSLELSKGVLDMNRQLMARLDELETRLQKLEREA